MRLVVKYPGAEAPFDGDLTLALQALPADARVTACTVRLDPVAAAADAFSEGVVFSGARGQWGSTKVVGADFVEVDFRTRRTLAAVAGAKLTGAGLLVDLGGIYVEVGARGGIRGPGEAAYQVPADGVLPGLTVPRFRFTGPAGVDITEVTVRSVPTNVSVRVGALPPVWTHVGDLTESVDTTDFGAVLAAALRDGLVVNGAYKIPLTVHSDTLCRFDVTWTIDYVRTVRGLPDGVADAQVVFDHASVPRSEPPVSLALPAGARVAATAGRLSGAFEPTRVLDGVLGAVTAASAVVVSGDRAQAQPQPANSHDRRVIGADLLLGPGTEGGVLQVQVVDDLDGKPGGTTLLRQPATLRLPPAGTAEPSWVGVRFPAEVPLLADRAYWLVLQAVDGAAAWSVEPESGDRPGLHHSTDAGLSWRPSSTREASAPVRALARLRGEPDVFEVPIHLAAGPPLPVEVRDARIVDPRPTVVSLERLRAQGRVDVDLSLPELAGAVQSRLEAVAPAGCPEIEHLVNGDFARWLAVGELTLPEDWELTDGSVFRPEATTGVGLGSADAPTGLSQLTEVSGGCSYLLEVHAGPPDGDAAVELIWRGADCGAGGLERIDLAPGSGTGTRVTSLHRLVVPAPAGAVQAEVRILLPAGASAIVESISLAATADLLRNGDLREGKDESPAGWSVSPPESRADLRVDVTSAGLCLGNGSDRPVTLLQRVAVAGAGEYEITVDALLLTEPDGPAPYVEIASPAATVRQDLEVLSFGRHLLRGSVAGASLELRLVLPPQPATVEYAVLWRGASARQLERNDVPVTIVAQAPGQLAIAGFGASYDLPAPVRAPIPPGGLCRATPPDGIPGALPDDCGYCTRCRGERVMVGTVTVETSAGRAAMVGGCGSCGGSMLRAAAPSPASGVEVVRPLPAYEGPVLPPVPPGAVSPVVVSGIGQIRAAHLAHAGIATVARLAEATPELVSGVLPGVPATRAAAIVAHARDLLDRAYLVQWVDRGAGLRDYERIDAVGGRNIDGTPWRVGVGQAVAGVSSGRWRLFVADPDGQPTAVVVARGHGRVFLTTDPARQRANLLLGLPDFPPSVLDDIRRRRRAR